jgi:Extensin-like protein C-terminus
MAWGWYLAGCGILGGVLAGCSGFMFAEREPWRREAELQCLQSGAVREGAGIVRTDAVRGPGVCGADFPLKVSALGESSALGFAEERRPTGAIGQPDRTAAPDPGAASHGARLGRSRAAAVSANVAPLTVTPAATLACPMVSELERWMATAVQPAAMRWFGSPVSEIKQISAYSCRGINGNSYARISEHAFGNALDIASFTLADGRTITVKGGWGGLPEEQGFLRDVQGAACDRFNTVLAPGSNVYHYDHIHVDLMRRHSGDRACNPPAVSGETVAARAARARYAGRHAAEPSITGALGPRRPSPPPQRRRSHAYEDHRYPARPLAEPGNDGVEKD